MGQQSLSLRTADFPLIHHDIVEELGSITITATRAPLAQVPAVIELGSRAPASGLMVFAWGGLRKEPEKVEAIGRAFRALAGREQ